METSARKIMGGKIQLFIDREGKNMIKYRANAMEQLLD
jgi:hypothetical protein